MATSVQQQLILAAQQAVYQQQNAVLEVQLLRQLIESQTLLQLRAQYPQDSYGFELRQE